MLSRKIREAIGSKDRIAAPGVCELGAGRRTLDSLRCSLSSLKQSRRGAAMLEPTALRLALAIPPDRVIGLRLSGEGVGGSFRLESFAKY
jgi:hypothetical protein